MHASHQNCKACHPSLTLPLEILLSTPLLRNNNKLALPFCKILIGFHLLWSLPKSPSRAPHQLNGGGALGMEAEDSGVPMILGATPSSATLLLTICVTALCLSFPTYKFAMIIMVPIT